MVWAAEILVSLTRTKGKGSLSDNIREAINQDKPACELSRCRVYFIAEIWIGVLRIEEYSSTECTLVPVVSSAPTKEFKNNRNRRGHKNENNEKYARCSS